MTDQMSVLVVM